MPTPLFVTLIIPTLLLSACGAEEHTLQTDIHENVFESVLLSLQNAAGLVVIILFLAVALLTSWVAAFKTPQLPESFSALSLTVAIVALVYVLRWLPRTFW